MPIKDPEKRREYDRARSRKRWNSDPEYRERRRAANRENIRARRADDADGTLRERERENLRSWQRANPERMAELNRNWRAANPEKVSEGNARSHRKGRHGLGPVKFAQLLADQGGRCCYCNRPLQGMELVAANLRRLTAEARERINGKPVQAQLFAIDEAASRQEGKGA